MLLVRTLAFISRVGQNRIHTPYMTLYLVISLPKIPYIPCICMVLANPIHQMWASCSARRGMPVRGKRMVSVQTLAFIRCGRVVLWLERHACSG